MAKNNLYGTMKYGGGSFMACLPVVGTDNLTFIDTIMKEVYLDILKTNMKSSASTL